MNSIVAIVLAFVTFLLLATFPGWHEEHDARTGSDIDIKPFPSRPVSQVALALIFIASIFVLVSVLWQHTASVAASQITKDFGNGSVKSGVGTTAMILGWFGFGLLVVVTIGLLVMILSIHLLDQLADCAWPVPICTDQAIWRHLHGVLDGSLRTPRHDWTLGSSKICADYDTDVGIT